MCANSLIYGYLRRWAETLRLPGAGLEPAWGYPRGIFLPLQLSLLRSRAIEDRRASAHLWSGLYLHPATRLRSRGLGGGRQVSTLSAKRSRVESRLSSVLQPP